MGSMSIKRKLTGASVGIPPRHVDFLWLKIPLDILWQ